MNKYGARRTLYAGEWYDSAGEARYAEQLDFLVAAGQIARWTRGTVWVLLDAPAARDRITYRPDFEVWGPDGRLRCLDFKGMLTREFKLKAKLWRHAYPDVPLIVVKEGESALAVVARPPDVGRPEGTRGVRRGARRRSA